jgi:hypothetical protein
MARTDPLPPAALQKIATQVGQRLSPTAAEHLEAGGTAQIGENFLVFMLGLDAIRRPAGRLAERVRPTGHWHHQIHHGTQVREFARSSASASAATPDVTEVTTSDAAARIDDAIRWIDQNVHDDAVARMLVVPAYYLTCFWLSAGNTDRVVVADKPEQLTALEYHRVYDGADFLRRLAAIPNAQGIPTTPPPGR